MTIFGTRPEIIRLSLIIPLLDRHARQVLVHTGQNYDPNLSAVFLDELGIRAVDHHLGVRGAGFADQAGQIMAKVDALLAAEKPDRVLILGDTNSGLAAIVAARRRIPVYHLEAGNRCYDHRVPEEVNRRIIDHCSDILMPYTERSAQNLVAEGIRRENIFVVGNPINEVIRAFQPRINASTMPKKLGLEPGGYFLATMHRAENVDEAGRLARHLEGLDAVARTFGKPVVLSVHPRTADRINQAQLRPDENRIRMMAPFGFFDFVCLEQQCFGVITDSGTVQEEVCLFGKPNVTIRDVTERPETTECGSNILASDDHEQLVRGMKLALEPGVPWTPPSEYAKINVATTVARILISHRESASR